MPADKICPPPEATVNKPSGDLYVKRVKHCVVTHSSLVLSHRGVDPACLFDFTTGKSRLEMNLVAVGSVLKRGVKVAPSTDRYVHVFNIWGTGYHHWIAEVALKLFLFEDLCRERKVVLPQECPGFVNEFLEAFEFKNTYKAFGSTYFKDLDLISNPNSGHFNKKHVELLSTRILDRFVPTRRNSLGERKIYISRRNARARKVINEDEVIAHLAERGFECFELDHMPFAEQVGLFSECSTLISLHGAALTNMIFMPPRSKVIEIYPCDFGPKDYFNACYRRLSDVLGIRHTYLFADREVADAPFHLHTDNVQVDLEELDTKLS